MQKCESCLKSDVDLDAMPCCNAAICWDFCLDEGMDMEEFRCFACDARVRIEIPPDGSPWIKVLNSGLTVKIARVNRSETLPAKCRTGVWALHMEPPGDAEEGYRNWTVTHIPSGMAARRSVTKEEADAAFELLTTHFRWWEMGSEFSPADRMRNADLADIQESFRRLGKGELDFSKTPPMEVAGD